MLTNPVHFIRQTGLIDPENLNQKIAIVGAGGIGSWTALALLKLGCSDVTVIDFDTVEAHNVGSQVYNSADAGKSKVRALEDRLASLTEIAPKTINTELTEQNVYEVLEPFEIVISAVDSITVRKWLSENLPHQTSWFIDGRMAGNAIEIYSVSQSESDREFYKKTIFEDHQSRPIPCSERAVVYNTLVIAGFIADIVAQIGNRKTPPKELIIDLANFAIFN